MGRSLDSLVREMSLKRSVSISLASLVLLACASLMFAQGGRDALLIEVTDAAGKPLKNACVTVIPKEGEITFRKADKRGRVRLKEIQPGNYRVVVKVDGYTAQKRQVTVGSAPETVAFSLQPRAAGEE
jgi:hypothetical protein